MLDPNDVIDFKSIEKCRNIKEEILNFGVNEKEIIKLIELLSLELEDTDLMRKISILIKKEEDTNIKEDVQIQI